jgi:hypothetical protein
MLEKYQQLTLLWRKTLPPGSPRKKPRRQDNNFPGALATWPLGG